MKIIIYCILIYTLSYSQVQLYPKGEDSNIRGVKFFNDSIGVFYGLSDKILYTEDGGNTLKDISIENEGDIGYIHFFDAKRIFVRASKDYETNNAGESWTDATINIPYPRFVLYNDSIVFYYYHSDGIFKSTDKGKTYTELPFRPDTDHLIIMDDTTYLSFCTQGDKHRTEDGGKTWQKVNDIALNCGTPYLYNNKIYIGSGYSPREPLVSSDKGKTYQRIFETNSDLWYSYDFRDTTFLVFSDRIHILTNNYLNHYSIYNKWHTYIYAVSPKLMFALYDNGRVLQIKDFGKSEKEIISSTESFGPGETYIKDENNFYLTKGTIMVHSSDKGVNWDTIRTIPFVSDYIWMFDENKWLKADQDEFRGPMLTTDAGLTWLKISNDEVPVLMHSTGDPKLSFIHKYKNSFYYNDQLIFGNGLYFRNRDDGLEMSSDYAKSWRVLENDHGYRLSSVYFLDSLTAWRIKSHYVYDSTSRYNESLYYTEDAFLTETLISTNLNFRIGTLKHKPVFINKLTGYVASSKGIWETFDGGKSFNLIFKQNTNEIFITNQKLYARTGNGNFYFIKDIPSSENNLLTADKINTPLAYDLLQNFPNPFNASTIIKYQLPIQGKVKLSIYNSIGGLVEEMELGEKTPGIYEVKYNPEILSSGVYFYQLTAGSYNNIKKFVLVK